MKKLLTIIVLILGTLALQGMEDANNVEKKLEKYHVQQHRYLTKIMQSKNDKKIRDEYRELLDQKIAKEKEALTALEKQKPTAYTLQGIQEIKKELKQLQKMRNKASIRNAKKYFINRIETLEQRITTPCKARL